jgi:hypothetical protein
VLVGAWAINTDGLVESLAGLATTTDGLGVGFDGAAVVGEGVGLGSVDNMESRGTVSISVILIGTSSFGLNAIKATTILV